MAAFTGDPFNAPLYARQIGILKADAIDVEGKLVHLDIEYTHQTAQGSGTGLIRIGLIPAGRIRIIPYLSRLVTSQFGASATISIGWEAYIDSLGVTQAASAAGFHSVGAAGAGALNLALALPVAGVKEFDSRDGVVITATIASGNIDATDTIYLALFGKRLS